VYKTRDGKPFRLVWFDGIACGDVPKPELLRDSPEFFAPTMTHEVAQKCRDGMSNGAFVYGTKGVIEYGHHGANYLRMLPDITLERLRADGGCPKERYPRNRGDSQDEKPFNEFVTAVKGGPRPGSDFAYAGMMTQCALLGVAALFDAGRTLKWDAGKAVFADSPAANARLSAERIF
jgi:predicted dehydrogenase